MRSINPTVEEAIEELRSRASDPNYYGTYTVALQGGRVAQVRDDRVLAVSRREKDNFNGNQKQYR